MIGAAAASDQLQIGQRRQEFRVVLGELGHVADIDLWGGIELSVTLGRGIGPQSADAADPRPSAPQLVGEVTRMGAIDHVIGRITAGRLVDLGNSDAKRLASGQGSVGLDREGEDDGQSGPLCGAGDADGLRRVGQSVGVKRRCRRAGKRLDLRTVIVERLRDGHGGIILPGIASGTDDAGDGARHTGGGEFGSNLSAKCNRCGVVLLQQRPIIAKSVGPVGTCAPAIGGKQEAATCSLGNG
jgi:hypothetical protein